MAKGSGKKRKNRNIEKTLDEGRRTTTRRCNAPVLHSSRMTMPWRAWMLLLCVGLGEGQRVNTDEQQTSELAFAITGTIDNFAPSRFPNGVLKGTYVTGCGAPPCGMVASPLAPMSFPGTVAGPYGGNPYVGGPYHPVVSAPGVYASPGNGILIAGDGNQDDPVDEIRFTQAKNNMAAAELSVE